MKRMKRLATGVLCGLLIAVLVVSGALIATRLLHDCPGAGCPVCTAIFTWEQLLRGMALSAAVLGALSAAMRSSRAPASIRRQAACAPTLVALKVKLSD